MATIRVELFGVLRRRAGVESTVIQTETESALLGDVLSALGDRFPKLAHECLDGPQLRKGYLANLDGNQFATDSGTVLPDGTSLLIMLADAGG